MKTLFVFTLLALLTSCVFGQKIDSIKYAYGHLYFHEYGTGEPVVILTGGPGANYQQMEEVAIQVGKKHRAILLEQRGTGRSMPKPYNATTRNLKEAHADLNRLLDHLKLKEAQILGHSWGAMLAMSFASEYPARVKSLILVDSGPFKLDEAVNETYTHNKEARLTTAEKQARNISFQKAQTNGATPEDKVSRDKWELIPVFYDRTKVDGLISIINKGGHTPQMGSFMFQDLGKNGFDLSKKLAQFTRPVYIIAGAQDPAAFVSYEIKILLPKAQLNWINKAGHFPMYEQGEAFYSALSKILIIK